MRLKTISAGLLTTEGDCSKKSGPGITVVK